MQFRTLNTLYTVIVDGNGKYLISGHPHYCPRAVEVEFDAFPQVGERFYCRLNPSKVFPYGKGFVTTAVQEVTP